MSKKILVILICVVIIVVVIFVGLSLTDKDGKESEMLDTDGDGYHDTLDAFPNNPNLWNYTIYSNSTWTLEYSPYILDSDFIVPQGLTLTIEPGAEVRLSGFVNTPQEFNATDIEVYGTLIAIGTVENMITFTSNENPDSETGYDKADWGEIDIKQTSENSIISYCLIEYAYNGIVTDADANISYNIIKNCGNVGVGWSKFSDSGILDSNIIENTSIGIAGTYAWQLEITNNIIRNNYVGIVFGSESNPIRVYHNIITGNYYGIDIENSNPNIDYNNISQNRVGIVFARQYSGWSASLPIISNNTIMTNSDYAISINMGAINAIAEYNYWGTTNETDIANMMDGTIDYDPWLSSPPWE